MLYMHSICIFLWAACSLYVSLCYVRCVAWGWWALSKHPTYLQSEVHHAFQQMSAAAFGCVSWCSAS